tara:strand:+ start:3406 stop:3681 length:276 start_codon:yes stop_codon:yes gene_type:complete
MDKDKLLLTIKIHVLKKLADMRCWVNKHTNINNMQKGLPPHYRDSKVIKKVIDRLIKEGFLLSKPTHYGLELSLNIKKKKEIEEFLEKYLY